MAMSRTERVALVAELVGHDSDLLPIVLAEDPTTAGAASGTVSRLGTTTKCFSGRSRSGT
eukprot:5076148-Amphidinium_carterae.1